MVTVNAFSLNWNGLSGYAFSPFALISRCLEKIRRKRLIFLWFVVRPTQSWYPDLLKMIRKIPRLLRSSPNLLVSAKGEPHPLLETGALQLATWKLSGEFTREKVFRAQWSAHWWPETVPLRIRHANQQGEIGLTGVFDGVKNSLSVHLTFVLEFLAGLHEAGKSYTSINVHRSMLLKSLSGCQQPPGHPPTDQKPSQHVLSFQSTLAKIRLFVGSEHGD